MKNSEQLSLDAGFATPEGAHIEWYMVTNQRNLFYMLGAGLILPSSGFGNKYYQDTLGTYPGWIPLFPRQVPKAAIEFSQQEKKHLTPCLLEISLAGMTGMAKAVSLDGTVKDIKFPEDASGDQAFILVPAPFPITSITSVTVESKAHKVAYEKDASDFDNVDLSSLVWRTDKKAFTRTSIAVWPMQVDSLPERKIPLDRAQAGASVLALLAQMGNRGDLAIEAAGLAFDQLQPKGDLASYRLLAPLGDWLKTSATVTDSGISAHIFWRLVESLIEAREQAADLGPLEVVCAELEKIAPGLDVSARDGIEKLVQDLRGLVGLGEHSVTELFERHSKPLPRALILFFLHDRCDELLEFKHPLLTEYDYLTAAILFAVRDRWLGLGTDLRKLPGLVAACSHRMAAQAHKTAGSSWNFGTPPSRPLSLRELLREVPWKKNQHEAALLLARKCGWNCIHTRVSLGKGKYQFEVDGTGAHILFEGEPKAVKTEAEYSDILTNLARNTVPMQIDHEARKLLGY